MVLKITAIGSPKEAVFAACTIGTAHAGTLTFVDDEWLKFKAALMAGAPTNGITLEVVEDFDDEPTVQEEKAEVRDDCAGCAYGTGTECILTHCPSFPDNT